MTAPTAHLRIRERLYEDILSGHLPPGSRLTVAPLCARYGASPTPIRAALQELQGQGLVTALPHHGFRVREIDEEYIRNVYEIRGAIIGILIPRVLNYINNDDFTKLEQILDKLARAIEGNDAVGTMRLNKQFFEKIYGIARNEQAFSIMENTWVLLDSFRSLWGFSRMRLDAVMQARRRLIKALKDRDITAAVAAFQADNDDAMQDMLEMSRRYNARREG